MAEHTSEHTADHVSGFTTADLPPSMQYRPASATLAAVRGTGLTLAIQCRHGETVCEQCVLDAARRVVAAADTPTR